MVSEYGSMQALALQSTDIPMSAECPIVRASSSVMTTGRTLIAKLPWKGVEVTSSARPSPPIRRMMSWSARPSAPPRPPTPANCMPGVQVRLSALATPLETHISTSAHVSAMTEDGTIPRP
jgi:hypothetical protein